jgi:RNA polymerase sigma-70 factor (ECF subfamily)
MAMKSTSSLACQADQWNALLDLVAFRPRSPGTGRPEELEREVAALHEANQPLMARYGLLVVNNAGVVDEAVQEAFLRYCEVRGRGQAVDNPRAWLFRVLRNYLIDQYRDQRIRSEVALEPHLPVADDAQNPELEMLRGEAWQRIEQLTTAKEFECLRLRAVGLSYAEIAEFTGVQEGTVASFLSRAASKIRTRVRSDRQRTA